MTAAFRILFIIFGIQKKLIAYALIVLYRKVINFFMNEGEEIVKKREFFMNYLVFVVRGVKGGEVKGGEVKGVKEVITPYGR